MSEQLDDIDVARFGLAAMISPNALPEKELGEVRSCACHPDDRPAVCQRRYATSECQSLAKATAVADALQGILDTFNLGRGGVIQVAHDALAAFRGEASTKGQVDAG